MRREAEEMTVNQATPEGEIVNDLTLGEYDIIITNQPERDSMEDSTFEQASAMRQELGVAIPDSVLIQTSRIPNKSQVLEAIAAESNSEQAQMQQQMDMQRQQAEIQKIQADAQRDMVDAQLKQVKAQQEAATSDDLIPPEVQLRVRAELESKKYDADLKAAVAREKMANDLRIEMLRANTTKEVKKAEPTKPAKKQAK